MDLDRIRKLSGQVVPHKELYENIRELDEAVDIEGDDLFDLERKMDAAKRGLGLANRLTGPSKKQHLARILGNLNQIRAAIKRAISSGEGGGQMGVEEFEPEEIEAAPAPDEYEGEDLRPAGGAPGY